MFLGLGYLVVYSIKTLKGADTEEISSGVHACARET